VRRPAPLVALLLVALAACSGGGSKPAAKPTTTTAAPTYGMTVTKADGVPDPVKAAVQATLDTWLRTGIVAPLRTGQPPQGVEAIFTPLAAPRLGGPDRASLVEDGSGTTATVEQGTAEAVLTPLTGADGNLTIVDAVITVSLTVTTPAGRTAVTRTGDLVLTSGTPWLIDSYDLVAKHDTVPPPPTTTTAAKKKGK
jgi:hypothetical protein